MSLKSVVGLVLIVIISLAADEPLRAQETGSASADAGSVTAPVQLDGSTLFRVRGVSSLPADARARLIEDRLHTVVSDAAIAVESIRIVESGGMSSIMANDIAIVSILDADGALEEVRREGLALAHLARIRQAVTAFRAARTPAALRRSAIAFLTATLLFAVLLVALSRVRPWADRSLKGRLRARVQSVESHSFDLVRAEQVWHALRSMLLGIRTTVAVVAGLVYVGFCLAQFPGSRGLSNDLFAFAVGPLHVMGAGILTNIPSLVFLTVLFFIVRVVLRFLRLFFGAVARQTITLSGFDPQWSEPTYKIVRIAVVAFGLVVAYPYIPGSSTAAFQGVSLFVGVLFSLGSSSALSNVIAGYMLTYRRALKVGDRVKIGQALGEVIEMRLQVTHLRSVKNEEIIIPNSLILASEVLNYSTLSKDQGLILHTEIGIGYDTAWRQAETLLLMAAERTEGLSKEPRPFVLEKRLAAFAVIYELNAYTSNVATMLKTYAEMHRHILDVFNEHGVQIMTPAYEGDPAEPKIVRPQGDLKPPPSASAGPGGA